MNLEPNVGKYTIHGSHGKQMQQTKLTNYYEGSPKKSVSFSMEHCAVLSFCFFFRGSGMGLSLHSFLFAGYFSFREKHVFLSMAPQKFLEVLQNWIFFDTMVS